MRETGSEWWPVVERIFWPTLRKLQTCLECIDLTPEADNLLLLRGEVEWCGH